MEKQHHGHSSRDSAIPPRPEERGFPRSLMIEALTAQARAQAAGYTLAKTGNARFYWVAPCKQKGGRAKHDTAEQAWQECCQTNQLTD